MRETLSCSELEIPFFHYDEVTLPTYLVTSQNSRSESMLLETMTLRVEKIAMNLPRTDLHYSSWKESFGFFPCFKACLFTFRDLLADG